MLGAYGLKSGELLLNLNSNMTARHFNPQSQCSLGVSLKLLLKGLFTASTNSNNHLRIQNLAYDSRKVTPNTLFFAIEGLKDNGNKYINEAIKRGAVAVVSAGPLKIKGVPTYQVENIRIVMAQVAKRFYSAPDEALKLCGITGTNGKTTVSTLTHYLFNECDVRSGLIGTITYDICGRTLPSNKTTPEAIDTFAFFDQMTLAKATHAFMEVSSHGLKFERVYGVKYDVAVFLNLTQEHLDFHENMENYYQAKKGLFTGKTTHIPRYSLINIDDPYGQRLLKELPNETEAITFGIRSKAMIRAEDVVLNEKGISFKLKTPKGSYRVKSKLLGHFNVSNILATMAIAYVYDVDMNKMLSKLEGFSGVRGRMEKVPSKYDFSVIIDYAHTDDALDNSLRMLKPITKNRLLVIFGCGGNRDKKKRPLMTSVVQKYANYACATSDNPRKEPVESIFRDMFDGVTNPDAIEFVMDRRRAIYKAIASAQPGDTILIAGKGHETYQEFPDTVVPFDDFKIAQELLTYKSGNLE